MRAVAAGTKKWLLGSTFLFGCTCFLVNAEAAQYRQPKHALVRPTTSLHAHAISSPRTLASGIEVSQATYAASRRGAPGSHGISCVPYARQVSGIKVVGNAWQWWNNAEGRYARGDQPEAGSVLNFRSNGRMRLGHVAVVTRLVNAREVIVDQANWPSLASRGNISHDVAVVDVSEANNWSAVRVELGRSGQFGSIYPTYGFIYNRPDSGLVAANVIRPAPQPAINPVPSDLRPVAERPWHTTEEVAELPVNPPRRIDPRFTSRPARPGQ